MLFEENQASLSKKDQPLPERVRPDAFDELFGQENIWSKISPLRKLVEAEKFNSLIFWGPPGTGKTTLSQMIGKSLGREVVALSAVDAGVKEIREQIKFSKENIQSGRPADLVFMDEVHRLSKNQQDVLLPALEAGTIKFIGATTENPSFEVNHAINSRSLVFRFESLSQKAILDILHRAIDLEGEDVTEGGISTEVLDLIARNSAGDARKALNLLEAILCSHTGNQEITCDSLGSLKESLALRYDKKGDNHFDMASALIKTIRASHVDAAVYYLARMLASGEDPMFIARRLMIAASEDIGNANPTALLMATSALQAVHAVGMPEARIILSQIVTYLAASPKSNRSYLAINKALQDVEHHGSLEIPMHLRNAPSTMMKDFGYGKGYQSPHDDLEKARQMAYLPEDLAGKKYYVPTDIGVEKQLKQNLAKIRPYKD